MQQDMCYESVIDPVQNQFDGTDRWTVQATADDARIVTAESRLGVLDVYEDGRLEYTVAGDTVDGDARRSTLQFVRQLFDGGRDWYAFDADRVNVTIRRQDGRYAVQVAGFVETADEFRQMLEYVNAVDWDASARLGLTDY